MDMSAKFNCAWFNEFHEAELGIIIHNLATSCCIWTWIQLIGYSGRWLVLQGGPYIQEPCKCDFEDVLIQKKPDNHFMFKFKASSDVNGYYKLFGKKRKRSSFAC